MPSEPGARATRLFGPGMRGVPALTRAESEAIARAELVKARGRARVAHEPVPALVKDRAAWREVRAWQVLTPSERRLVDWWLIGYRG